MNQLEIEQQLDKLSEQTESDIEEVFNKRLQEILKQVAGMYAKYSNDNEISWTNINRYNRYRKEMNLIKKELNKDYRKIIKKLQKSNENIYLEGYLLTAFLYEMSTGQDMGFSIPSVKTIKDVLLNPIAELTLPKIFENHRNEIVRKIKIELAQGIQAGEGYATMAKRIEKTVKFSQYKARTVARTEGARARSISAEKSEEQASKYVDITGVWLSSLDTRVRLSHRSLDGEETNAEGYFTYGPNKATAPLLWIGPDQAKLTINCRCQKLRMVNGMLPEYRRGRNYMDSTYQQKLADRIDEYLPDMTYKQALKKAKDEIKPPPVTFPYITYDEWEKKYS